MEHAIDFVMTWVDGGDVEWLREKARYRGATMEDPVAEASRYREWGILKYWFRAVEANAPWVRTIHLVTNGQVPDFLDPAYPKLHLVTHSEIMPAAHLPTFNSMAIEVNLCHIKGLSEHFVYFNDDMYINRPVSEGSFFRGGKPCYELICREQREMKTLNPHQQARREGMAAVWRHFGKRDIAPTKLLNPAYGLRGLKSLGVMARLPEEHIQFTDIHIPYPYLRSTMEEVWQKEQALLDRTSSHRFREAGAVNQYIFRYWDLARGNFAPSAQEGERYDVATDNLDRCVADIREGRVPLLCLNDSEACDDFERCRDALIEAFEARYPKKSSFER